MTESKERHQIPRFSGFAQIILATAIAGIAGYLVTWLVPRKVGFDAYALFAIFWSLLFFIVSALSGIQQEVTRATRPVSDYGDRNKSRISIFGFVVAAFIFVAMVSTATLWADFVFPAEGWSLVWPLAVGTAFYVLVAVLNGSLYGISRWGSLFWMICAEALLRLAAVGVALIFTSNITVLAWTVALPFPATLLLLWPFVRGGAVGRTTLDVGYRRLCANIARTTIAAASMGLMVSGFPFILGLTSVGEPRSLLGLLILAVTLTRAPLIIVMMALQSYLIIYFRNLAGKLGRSLLGILALVSAAAIVLGVFGWWLGPPVFAILFPGELVPYGWLIAALIGSSALVGGLCVTAPAVLSVSQHVVYSAGWVAAAVVTILGLLMPLDLVARAVLALFAGPVAGLLVHGSYLVVASRARTTVSPVIRPLGESSPP